ncbi:MAG: hypothetical protein ACJAYU_001416 [Bradymonadia bacterium]
MGPVERLNIVVVGAGFEQPDEELARLSIRDNTYGAD